MGLLRRLKVLRDPAFKEWRAAEEQWAQILEIQRHGPVARIRMEIHFSNLPVSEVTATSRIPRGVDPQVGQHVAYHLRNNGEQSPPSYVVDWEKPPQYGAPPYDPQAAGQQLVAQLQANPTVASVADPAAPEFVKMQLEQLRQMHAAGSVSDAELAEKQSELRRWAANPEQENDPEFQLQRLERQHAEGVITGADYAQRKVDLENWRANLRRLGP